MKKYIKPEIEITQFDVEDIITTSGVISETDAPINIIGGVRATGYGAKDFNDIFK